MSDPEPTPEVSPVDQREPVRSAVPFIAAAAVAVLVVVGIVVAALLRPAEKNVTDSDRLASAVREFATAQGGSDTARLAATACTGFDQARSPLGADAAGK